MNNTYSSITTPNDQESGSSGESLRIFDSSFNTYSPHSNPYSDYPTPSKLEAFDYNYWPATTTHNILANPMSTVIDQIQTPSSTIETFVPVSAVNLSHINASTTLSTTHHHHHIHQHLYPPSSPTTCNDPSGWLGSGDYQSLHPTNNQPSFHHYPSPCSLYPTNNFYDTPQSQWTSPPALPSTTTAIPIKYESSYSPPPSYFESPNSLHHGPEHISKEEPSDSYQSVHYLRPPSSSSNQLNSVPPRNPLNGKTRTRDKYRIVYTDQQRYELENEFVVSKYISIPRKSALSLTLALSERQIKIWFQNRRAKERKLNKKRQDATSTRQLNNSNDGDSPSDGGVESPNYYSNYS